MTRSARAVERALEGAPHKLAVGIKKAVDAAKKRKSHRRTFFKGTDDDRERRDCARLAHAMEDQMRNRKELQERSDAWKRWYGAVVNELRAASRHNLRVMEEALEAGGRSAGDDAHGAADA